MTAARRCECGATLAYRQRRCADCKKSATYDRQSRWRLARYVPPAPREVTACAVDGCDTRAHARGWCNKHWSRWRRTGDPLGMRDNGRPPKGDAPGYDAAHRRISRSLGPASDHPCVECGGEAREWSYDGGDPDELVTEPAVRAETPGLRYSLKATFYSPRCVACHRRRDGSTLTPRERDALGRYVGQDPAMPLPGTRFVIGDVL